MRFLTICALVSLSSLASANEKTPSWYQNPLPTGVLREIVSIPSVYITPEQAMCSAIVKATIKANETCAKLGSPGFDWGSDISGVEEEFSKWSATATVFFVCTSNQSNSCENDPSSENCCN